MITDAFGPKINPFTGEEYDYRFIPNTSEELIEKSNLNSSMIKPQPEPTHKVNVDIILEDMKSLDYAVAELYTRIHENYSPITAVNNLVVNDEQKLGVDTGAYFMDSLAFRIKNINLKLEDINNIIDNSML